MPQITDWILPGTFPGTLPGALPGAGCDNPPILGNTHMPDAGPDAAIGIMLICHGFKGYKDYGFFPHLAQAAAAAGLIAHRFNFSHSGMTNHIETFEHPELFERDTWRKQSADLKAVIAAANSGTLPGGGPQRPMTIFGHSRGGLTTLLTAGDWEPGAGVNEKLAAVIAASSPSACSRLEPEQKDLLKRVGRMPSPSSRTGQTLYVGRSWQDEIDQDPIWHDPCRAIAAIKCPVMLIQGTDDTTVTVRELEDLHRAKPDAKVLVIEGAGHTYNAPNPLALDQTPPKETRQMIDAACGFAAECCAPACHPNDAPD